MDLLHERLDEKAGGKLPDIEEDAEKLLRRFDEDNNGRLDKEEFRRFSRVYFSRLEWPLWRVTVKGFGVGCAALAVAELAIAPVAKVVAGVVIPKMIAKMKKELGAAMSDSLKLKVEKMKARFGDGNLNISVSEKEARDIRRLERRARMKKRAKYAQKVVAMGAMGAAAAATGLF